MKITSIKITPEKKTADVWDAVTETEVQNNAGTDLPAHLKTYILNEKGAANRNGFYRQGRARRACRSNSSHIQPCPRRAVI